MRFTDIIVEWSTRTFLYYLAIILGSYLIAYGFKNKNIRWGYGKEKKYPVGLLIVAIILLAVKCFNTTGRDLRRGYYSNFLSATSMAAYRDQTVEPGFRLLMVAVRVLTNNYAVFLFIVGLLTVIPVVHFIHKYRDKIDVPIAVLMYTSLYYINSFSACRQYLAVSISLFVFDAIIEKKPYRALAWIVVASTVHVTCLILVIPYMLCFAKMLSKKLIVISALVCIAAFYFGRNSISAFLGGMERYDIYSVNQQVRFGFEQIVYYAPLFLLIYLCRKRIEDKGFFKISFIYLTTGFTFGMLSYILPIFGRMQAVFIPIVLIIPYYIKSYKLHCRRSKRQVTSVVVLFYCIARFVIWIVQYYSLEDLMPYSNVFGMII